MRSLRRPCSTVCPSLLVRRAREMRTLPTRSEELLWRALRKRALGVEFRRQVPIGSYIVDFLAPQCRIIIEIDGGWHLARCSADARRDEKLRRAGYRILRLAAGDVLTSIEQVLARIARLI